MVTLKMGKTTLLGLPDRSMYTEQSADASIARGVGGLTLRRHGPKKGDGGVDRK